MFIVLFIYSFFLIVFFIFCFFFFFFSSRRRHTRLVSDWSSDVCSSDLGDSEQHLQLRLAMLIAGQHARKWTFRSEQRRHQVGIVRWLGLQSRAIGHPLDLLGAGLGDRSEERRAGKEGRSRWGRWTGAVH